MPRVKEGRTAEVKIRLDPDLVARMDEEIDKAGMKSRSVWIGVAIVEKLDGKPVGLLDQVEAPRASSKPRRSIETRELPDLMAGRSCRAFRPQKARPLLCECGMPLGSHR